MDGTNCWKLVVIQCIKCCLYTLFDVHLGIEIGFSMSNNLVSWNFSEKTHS